MTLSVSYGVSPHVQPHMSEYKGKLKQRHSFIKTAFKIIFPVNVVYNADIKIKSRKMVSFMH